jgi:hypothetical protein
MRVDDFRLLIEAGNVDGLRGALEREPKLANQTIRWFLNQQNESDPLHYVCDCFGHGWLINGKEGEIAEVLLASGAHVAAPVCAVPASRGRDARLGGAD